MDTICRSVANEMVDKFPLGTRVRLVERPGPHPGVLDLGTVRSIPFVDVMWESIGKLWVYWGSSELNGLQQIELADGSGRREFPGGARVRLVRVGLLPLPVGAVGTVCTGDRVLIGVEWDNGQESYEMERWIESVTELGSATVEPQKATVVARCIVCDDPNEYVEPSPDFMCYRCRSSR
jgi:hypothetical protein